MKEKWKTRLKIIETSLTVFILAALATMAMTLNDRVAALESRVAAVETTQKAVTGNMMTVMDVMRRIASTVTR